MSNQVSKVELHRVQFEESLAAVADSMRTCAQVAESFAKAVKAQHLIDSSQVASEDSTKGKRKAAFSPDEADGPKKRKRNTKPKDPNAPKRPASSYILFQNEVRKELKEQHPNLSNSDLLGLISEQWKHMSDEQKETYNQAMKTAKAQYSEEKKAYDNRSPEEVEAANAAAAAASSLKKANAKPRGPKPAAPAPEIKARPPPAVEDVSPSSDTSEEEEDSEEEPARRKPKKEDTESSEEEEEEEPASKKRRGASAQPAGKSKKNSKV